MNDLVEVFLSGNEIFIKFRCEFNIGIVATIFKMYMSRISLMNCSSRFRKFCFEDQLERACEH